jgi:hypothetical protein
MLRYHKKVYIDPKDLDRLKTFTERLNSLNWGYSNHCLDIIKDRAIDLEGLLKFIKGFILDPKTIFEFYADDKTKDIIKVCYRINWQGNNDIILVVSEDKEIITIYMNEKNDNHITLRQELYCKG